MDEFREANLRNWESRVPVHAGSPTYDLAGFASDPRQLSQVVAQDARYLGDLHGLDVVHLQCHIGKDTLSLARLGARVTGVDFSPSALEAARALASATGIENARFILSELYDTPNVLGADFDLVYTGVGALNWLPDIRGWAAVVAALLRPGGRLYVRDEHPMLAAIQEERTDDQLVVAYPYFEGAPLRWEQSTTYVDDLPISEPVIYQWNHGLGEIVAAVIDAGLTITALREGQACPWKALRSMVETDDGWFVLPERPERLPLMFTLEATRAHD